MISRLTIFSFDYHGYTGIYDEMHGLTREVDIWSLMFCFFSSIKWIFFCNFCRTFGPALKRFLSDIHKKCPIVRQVRRILTPLEFNKSACDLVVIRSGEFRKIMAFKLS